MQINRLFEMIYLLMERDRITAGELAERFEVSTRTIYRDVDLLSGSGIPIYASKGKGGGIRLLPHFVLNKSVLTEEERDEILFALQSMKAVGQGEETQVLSRLSALFQKEGTDWIDVDFSPWGGGQAAKDAFRLLKTAILERRVLEFTYFSSYGRTTRRQVEPVRLRFKGGSWYLQGYCPDREAYRTFKVIRMEDIHLSERTFSPREEPVPPLDGPDQEWDKPRQGAEEEADHVPGIGRPAELRLRFQPELSYRVYDEFPRREISREEDGRLTVTVHFPLDFWVYSYLLSFGAGMEVISPPEVRETLGRMAESIARLYAEKKTETFF